MTAERWSSPPLLENILLEFLVDDDEAFETKEVELAVGNLTTPQVRHLNYVTRGILVGSRLGLPECNYLGLRYRAAHLFRPRKSAAGR